MCSSMVFLDNIYLNGFVYRDYGTKKKLYNFVRTLMKLNCETISFFYANIFMYIAKSGFNEDYSNGTRGKYFSFLGYLNNDV